jgi:hypothetical protein
MAASDATPAAGEPDARQDDAELFEVQQLRAMEQPSWNEGRLDDLSKRVDEGIGRLDEERKGLRAEVKEGFDRVDKRFDRVDQRFDRVDKRFEKVDEEFKAVRGEMKAGFDGVNHRFVQAQWTLIGAAAAIAGAVIGASQL